MKGVWLPEARLGRPTATPAEAFTGSYEGSLDRWTGHQAVIL